MTIYEPGVNIGKAIADRIRGYPVLEKEIKRRPREKTKRKPRKRPACWIVCPNFIARPPKTMSRGAGEKPYSFSVLILSETRKERDEALGHMIRCGQEEIKAGNKRFWLHAVEYGLQHSALFRAELKYIFRLRQSPGKIS